MENSPILSVFPASGRVAARARRWLLLVLLAAPLTVLVGCSSDLGDRLQDAAREGAERAATDEVSDRADRAVRGTFDAAEDAVRCLVTDRQCIERAEAEGRPVEVVDDEGNVVEQIPGEGGAAIGGADANYDFEPGTRVLFADDFSGDNVGDFPRRLEFVNGSWEIAELQGQRFLRNTGPKGSAFKVPLPETLPERYTIEFDAHFPHGNQELAVATVEPEDGRIRNLEDQNYFDLGNNRSGLAVQGEGVEALQPYDDPFAERVVPVRIMVDGTYVKVYLGQRRVANVPNADLPRSNTLWFENTYFADAENPMYIGDIRVAAGGRDLYDALETSGRATAQGILFETGSATIRPASADVLGEIAAMLSERPDLRLRIEGHTDDTGAAETNQRLNQQRAEAVKAALVDRYGIAASRLTATGMGSASPAASNDTAEGRRQNRRVELVRL